MKRELGGRAYPYENIQERYDGKTIKWSNGQGVHLIDYYAAHIISGLLANPKNKIFTPEEISKLSFDIAESMVNESIRSKKD